MSPSAKKGRPMAKAAAKRKRRAGRPDPAEFDQFIEAAPKRGADETLDQFATRFLKFVPPKRRAANQFEYGAAAPNGH
jgi:hypothetical protein